MRTMRNNAKLFLFAVSLIIYLTTSGQLKKQAGFIDPTGSYHLVNKTTIRNGDRYGYFGELKVKMLKHSRIAVSFYICKGAPGYNSGSFIDTLVYKNNQAIYTTPAYDSTCTVTLIFMGKGTSVKQYQSNINNGCGFGNGVAANGFFKKTSIKIPVIEDLNDKQDW